MSTPHKRSFAAEELERRKSRKSKLWIPLGIAIVVLVVAGYLLYSRYLARESVSSGAIIIKSIAVLPLKSFSDDPDQINFTNAMHDLLIKNLSRVCSGKVHVISRQSAQVYVNSNKTLPEIGMELDVDALIEGSVYSSDNQVRITVQLIAMNPERHLWEQDYTRELRDVLSLQNEVTGAIASGINVAISSEEKTRLAGAQTVDPEAFNLFVRGLSLIDQMKMDEAVEVLERAVAESPGFAQAYGLLSIAYYFNGQFEKAKRTADRALELDPTLVDPHLTYAILHQRDSDWDAAEREIKQAISLDPSNSVAYFYYANQLRRQCRYDEAFQLIADAQKIDPRSPYLYGVAVAIYAAMDRFDDAVEQYRRGIEFNPGNPYLSQHYARMLYKQGNYEKAKEIFNNVGLLEEGRSGYIDALAGKREEAGKVLNSLIKQYKEKHVSSIYIVFIYTAFGEKGKALDWLERQYRDDWTATFIKTDFEFDPLRSEPRFQALLKKMNLAD